MSIKELKEELREMMKDCTIKTHGKCEPCAHLVKCRKMSERYTPDIMLFKIEQFEQEQKERGNSYE